MKINTQNSTYSNLPATNKNFLKSNCLDLRIIDVAMAQHFGQLDKQLLSPVDWMNSVGRDFSLMAFTFGLCILCPEYYNPRPPYLDRNSLHPDADKCVNLEVIREVMRRFDPDLYPY